MKTCFTNLPVTRRALLALAALSLIASPLHAANITWSGADGDFNDTANWTGGVLPGGGDIAIIGNGGSVSQTDVRAIGGLTVSNGSYTTTSGQMLNCVGPTTVGSAADGFGKYELNNGQFFAAAPITVGADGGDGLFSFINGFVNRTGGGAIVVGQGAGSNGEFYQASGFLNCMTPLQIGADGATGLFNFTGSSAANAHDWFIVGADGGDGTFRLGGMGSFNKLPTVADSHVAIGRGNDTTAVVEQSGGLFTNVSTDTYLGESGNASGSWTVSGGTDATTTVFATLVMGHSDAATASFALNGGTLFVNRIVKGGSTGATSFVFNGGILKPRLNEPDFISGIDSVTVEDGGLFIDTTPQANSGFTHHDIGIAVDLIDGGGGLTKRGVGSLRYEGSGHYTGATVVEGGTLYVDGALTGSDVTVQEDGAFGGSGTVGGSVTVHGALVARIPSSGSEPLAIAGDLNVEGATLKVELPDGPVASGPYVIATYGTRSGGDFAAIEGITGYVVDYAYEGNKIAIVPGGSPFDTWASAFTWESEGDELADADPDGDGYANVLEFFLGGDPLVSEPPTGKPSGSIVGDRFIFTFERNAGASAMVPVIEYGTGLDFPSVAADGVDGIIITAMDSPGGETWTVSFPMPPAGKLFARLKVEL